MSSSTSTSSLSALVGILSSGVQTLESEYTKQGSAYPSLNDPFAPGPLDSDATVNATARLVVAAAYQIIAAVRTPFESIQEYGTGMYAPAALSLVVDIHIPNLLKDAGEQVNMPIHFQDLWTSAYNAHRGSMLGISQSRRTLRPTTWVRGPSLPPLYLVFYIPEQRASSAISPRDISSGRSIPTFLQTIASHPS